MIMPIAATSPSEHGFPLAAPVVAFVITADTTLLDAGAIAVAPATTATHHSP